jgi:hypothetical protein
MRLLLALGALLALANAVYIAPGPRYRCPRSPNAIFPCECIAPGDAGVEVRCDNANLASLGVALANLGAAGMPVEKLTISRCHIGRCKRLMDEVLGSKIS